MEDKEDEGANLFLHQLIDFAPGPAQACTLAALFPPHPLHQTVAVDEARNVPRSGNIEIDRRIP